MRVRLAAVLVTLGVVGCASEDDWIVRPPGGGGGGSGTRDAGGGVDGSLDAAQLQGLICVVTDLRSPDDCPEVAERFGVVVGLEGSTATATSDTGGIFSIEASNSIATLYVGDGSTTLQPSTVPVTVTTSVVNTPIPTASYWDAVIASLGVSVPDTSGAIAVYVVDAGSPATGVTFSMVAGSSVAPFYDNGGALAWVQSGGTGAAGVALLVDVPAGSYGLIGTAPDLRTATLAGVPVRSNAVTFVRGTLAP